MRDYRYIVGLSSNARSDNSGYPLIKIPESYFKE